MKNFGRVLGIIAIVAVIGFAMVACDTNIDDINGPVDGSSYKLTWGVWTDTTYSYVYSQFTAQGVKPISAGTNAGYITGSDAENVASYIQTNYQFDDSGEVSGTFESLLNYKKDGIGAPQALKTAMSAQKGNVPVGGIFQAQTNDGTVVIAFYIERGSSGNGGGGGNGTYGDFNYYTTANNAITIAKYNGKGGDVTIPSQINGKPVTEIGAWAFRDCTGLTSVTIPLTINGKPVTGIGEFAFSGLTTITGITIPDSVTSIGNGAFRNCTSLTAINVGSGNTAYSSDNGVLYNKNKTTLLQYPAGKTGSTFTIPNSVTSIGQYAFQKCTSLASVTIPNIQAA